MTTPSSGLRVFGLACTVFAVLALGEHQAHAQGRDSLLNGAVIGAAVGAGVGVAFTHAVRDSDLVFSQYARGALTSAPSERGQVSVLTRCLIVSRRVQARRRAEC
jgi:hypothetical protein